MKAGRELDALVAEKVMGMTFDVGGGPMGMTRFLSYVDGLLLSRRNENTGVGIFFSIEREKELMKKLPHYSTDIAAAWEAVERMREHLDITISANQNTCEVRSRDFPDQIIACEQGDTIPHAICLASLKAVGK